MKILVINPNTTLEMTKSIGEMAEKYCARGTEITAISPDRVHVLLRDTSKNIYRLWQR